MSMKVNRMSATQRAIQASRRRQVFQSQEQRNQQWFIQATTSLESQPCTSQTASRSAAETTRSTMQLCEGVNNGKA